MKTLYVSDLDGTLFGSDIRVSERSADMLNRAIDCGALFTVATARTPGTLWYLLKDIRLRLPAIVMTGATMWHRDTGLYTDTHYFPPALVKEILGLYRRQGLSSFMYTLSGNRIHVYHQGPLSDMERDFIRERRNNPHKTIHIADDGSSPIPEDVTDAILFFGMQPSYVGHPAYEALKRIQGINPMFYNDANFPEIAMIEAFPEGASKANAIRRLARRTGAERIVAFGDNFNDLPMLEAADLAVAVGNAIPEVREKADIVIGHHDSDAVAEFILEDYMENLPAATRHIMSL